MYVYIKSEPSLWTVGFYDPKGEWQPESDHTSTEDAANRVAFLNGHDASLRAALKEIELRTSTYRDGWETWPLAAGINFEARKALGLSH